MTPTGTRTSWLAIQFPRLPMDLATRGLPSHNELPLAINDGDARKPRVLDCSPAAARLGIRPGMAIGAALGMAEGLCVLPRRPDAEQAALERLAGWCYQYSSQVSLCGARQALLLEVGASQRLFGEPPALAARMNGHLQSLGFHARTGTAPTPEAAQLAAPGGLHLRDTRDIQAQLGALPLDRLPPVTPRPADLEKMGFRSLAEVLRLPRKALARRQGPALVDYLDRLTGARPDPQPHWRPPDTFATDMDLSAEIGNSQALAFPLRRLVAELCGTLRATDRGVQVLRILLTLRKGQEALRVGLQRPGRDEARIMLLLRERLERLRLRQPVRHVALVADELLPFDTHQEPLFEDAPGSPRGCPVEPLLERLAARLGGSAVQGLRGIQDHRPEYSWSVRAPGEDAACEALPHRPVWLYPHPEPCRITDYRLLAGPERIESGWWDGHDCRRDYYVVRDAAGSTLWAYREYKPNPGWYLHGVFG